MNDNSEPSYYEIALTNRQVLIAFVVILGSLLISFLSGVWIGRKESPLPASEAQIATLGEAEGPDDQLESLGFFSENDEGEESDRPDLSPILGTPPAQPSTPPAQPSSPPRETTLAEDVGSASPPSTRTEAAPERQAPPPTSRQASPPAPTERAAPPPPPQQAAPQAAAPQEGFVIQVFSTRDEPQARKVLKQLKGGGFSAFMSPVQVENQTMYRVRVGPFSERSAAEKQAVRVKSQFRLDTWVTAASN